MKRAKRKLFAWLTIASVLFAQIALSAYACPMDTQVAGIESQQSAQSTVPPSGCNDMAGWDQQQPNLCFQHCEDGKQNVDNTTQKIPAMDLPLLAVVPLAIEIDPPKVMHERLFFVHKTSPPPTLRFCVFRI